MSMRQAPFLEFGRKTSKILAEKSLQFLEAAVESAANDCGYLVHALPRYKFTLDRGHGKPERRLAVLTRDGQRIRDLIGAPGSRSHEAIIPGILY